MGDLGKFFCAANVHTADEIKTLINQINAKNPDATTLNLQGPGGYTVPSITSYWSNPPFGNCTLGLDQNFDFLTTILKRLQPQTIISVAEEQQILQQTLPVPQVQGNFLSRNAMPIFLGGTVLILGIVGFILMTQDD